MVSRSIRLPLAVARRFYIGISLLIALMASWASGRLTLDLCWSAPFAILCKSVGKPLSVTPVTIQCVVLLEPFAGRYDRVNSCQFFRIGRRYR